jgi:hypothetical protein
MSLAAVVPTNFCSWFLLAFNMYQRGQVDGLLLCRVDESGLSRTLPPCILLNGPVFNSHPSANSSWSSVVQSKP